MSGQFFETWVVSEIYKSYTETRAKRAAAVFTTKGTTTKRRLGLIVSQDGTVYPIEIKKGSAPKDAIKNFSVLSPIEADPF